MPGRQAVPCSSSRFPAPLGRLKPLKIQDSHSHAWTHQDTQSLCSSYKDNHPVTSTTGSIGLGAPQILKFPCFGISAPSTLFLLHMCTFAEGYEQYYC